MQHSRLKQSAILSGVVALGLLVLAVGLYLLTVLDYHEHADLGPGAGTVCPMGAIVGTIVARSSALVTRHEILRAKAPAALALARTEEQELQLTEGAQSS